MALFGWSERDRVREKSFQAGIDSVSDREVAVAAKEREQATRGVVLEAQAERITTLNKNHDEIEVLTNQAKFDLEKASFESDKADFEITKKLVANDKLQLDKTLAQAKADYEAQVKVELMNQAIENDKLTSELYTRVAKAEAKVDAKDLIITSKHGEILRLDELLKVTMGKLTQIDVKGLTIHVENERGASKKEEKE